MTRRENADRFLAGAGNFVPDLAAPGMRYVAFVRSPYPHARLGAIDTSRALSLAGVSAVITGADLRGRVAPVSPGLPTPPFRPLAWPLLPTDKVRYVGDPVAAVVADSPYLASDGAALVDVAYDEMSYVDDVRAAAAPGAPLLYEEWGTNVFVRETFEHGDVAAGLAAATGVVHEEFVHHRVCGFPLEGQGVCAYREAAGRLIVHASTQYAHQMRAVLAQLTGLSTTDIRVVAPDVGGGFGVKQHVTREELLVGVLGWLLPYPVRWTQDVLGMLEHGIHAREQHHEVTAGYTDDGRICALRLRGRANVGNPVLLFTGAAPAFVTAASLTGAYAVPAYAFDVAAVATNTSPVGGLRGFGQPQALFSMERTLDLIARRLSMDPAEVRRVNLIPDGPRPYVTLTGFSLDCGSIRSQFDHLLGMVERQPSHVDEPGLRRGLGFACYVEPTATSVPYGENYVAYETATLAVNPDGSLVAAVGTKDIGQGCLATFARILSDELGIDTDKIDVRDGDTDLIPIGLGTMGSRTLVMTGGALRDGARKLRAKLSTIAAHVLDVPVGELTLSGGGLGGRGRSLTVAEIAEIAYLSPASLPADVEPGLFVTGHFHARHVDAAPDDMGRLNPAATYSSQVAAARVDVDPTSGEVKVVDFTMVYDCGTVANSRAVEGQIQGSFALGLSTVLFEQMRYEQGRPDADTYPVARARDVPRVHAVSLATESSMPGGSRGVGQIGTILAPAAIGNAVADALRPLGVEVRQTNLSPAAIRQLIASSAAGASGGDQAGRSQP
jgi:carbon-monoxide dehydrogenase large subunit